MTTDERFEALEKAIRWQRIMIIGLIMVVVGFTVGCTKDRYSGSVREAYDRADEAYDRADEAHYRAKKAYDRADEVASDLLTHKWGGHF